MSDITPRERMLKDLIHTLSLQLILVLKYLPPEMQPQVHDVALAAQLLVMEQL